MQMELFDNNLVYFRAHPDGVEVVIQHHNDLLVKQWTREQALDQALVLLTLAMERK